MKKISTLFTLVLVISSLGVVAVHAQLLPVPSGSVFPDGWDLNDSKWDNGKVKGYVEGQTAPMLTAIDNQMGMTYWTDICVQVYAGTYSPGDPFAFLGFAPWNTSVTMVGRSLPDGTIIDYGDGNWDLDHPEVWGYKTDIISVAAPAQGLGPGGGGTNECDPAYYGVRVVFTPLAASGAYIIWGGHMAKPGDPIPADFFDETGLTNVPLGQGASAVGGGFKTRVEGSGDKTINFASPEAVPTAVDLASFTAVPHSGAIDLSWETVSEADNLGFNLYRSASPGGPRIRLNEALIPSQLPPGSPLGATYTFVDETALPGITYYYWLEDLDIYGLKTEHGPVSAGLPSLRWFLPSRPRPSWPGR